MTQPKPALAVIGAGSFGTTLAQLLAWNGHAVQLWTHSQEIAGKINHERANPRLPSASALADGITATTDLQSVCAAHRLLFLALPPVYVLPLIAKMQPLLAGDHSIVYTLRYVFGVPQQTLSEIITERTLVRRIAFLTGPVVEEEALQKNPLALTVASPFSAIREQVAAALGLAWLRVYPDSDMAGVEWTAAFANVGMLAAGLAAGLGFGSGTLAFIINRMTHEIATVLKHRGHPPAIAEGMAGSGTMIAAVIKGHDPFWHWGLAKGKKRTDAADTFAATGRNLLHSLANWATEERLDLPLTRALYDVFCRDVSVAQIADLLLRRPAHTL
jgi:glycerol-3-phosphate dehydrogenase (NAD(P)+)